MKKLILTFIICVFSHSFSIKAEAQHQGYGFWLSRIAVSENKEFIFVELSTADIDKYIASVLQGWKDVDFTKKELAESKKGLLANMDKERAIRRKYKVSGIYKADSDTPLYIINDFPIYMLNGIPIVFGKVFVADDGSYVVGLNDHISFDMRGGETQEELLSASRDALFSVSFEGQTAKNCSAKVSDFIDKNSPLSRGVHGFFWAYKAHLNNSNNTLEIQLLNEEKAIWDIKNCSVIRQETKEPAENKPALNNLSLTLIGLFLAAVSILGLMIYLSVARRNSF